MKSPVERVACALLLLQAAPAAAQSRPAPGTGDPRIQTVTYDANQVVQLQVAGGYQLDVEFAPGERIETVAVGDSNAWSATPNKSGDHLFVKLAAQGVTTNMTVVTDARSYTFELLPAYGPLPSLAYIVRFIYPATTATVAAAGGAAGAPVKATPVPGRYRLGGARGLRPSAISDDGVKTYITFAPDRPMPAIFTVGAAGGDVPVEGAVRDGRYVIDGVKRVLVFRIDKRTAHATRVRQ